jgi:hypothetical protein
MADSQQIKSTNKPTAKKKAKRSVPNGQVHILATFNNTVITFTDMNGGALAASKWLLSELARLLSSSMASVVLMC